MHAWLLRDGTPAVLVRPMVEAISHWRVNPRARRTIEARIGVSLRELARRIEDFEEPAGALADR